MADTNLDILPVKRALQDRGVELNNGFSGDFVAFVEKEIGLIPDPIICEVYYSFDGFPEGVVDGGSCIRVWPSREIVADRGDSASSSRIAFADLMMGSQELTFDISDSKQPILYGDTGEEVAGSMSEFITSLASGKLDFQ